jgi:hypothetical protein
MTKQPAIHSSTCYSTITECSSKVRQHATTCMHFVNIAGYSSCRDYAAKLDAALTCPDA